MNFIKQFYTVNKHIVPNRKGRIPISGSKFDLSEMEREVGENQL